MRKTSILLLVLLVGCGGRGVTKKASNAAPNNTTTASNNGTTGMNSDSNNATTGSNNSTISVNNNTLPPLEDDDGDGILNSDDNCPTASNAAQADQDGDTVGDACDNCPDAANRDQADANDDGVGDGCEGAYYYQLDLDTDRDATIDVLDNCRLTANPGQDDLDSDLVGDLCDNCPDVANPDQTDTDGDGEGDACSASPQGMLCPSPFSDLAPDLWLLADNSGSITQYEAEYRQGLLAFTNARAQDTRMGVSGQSDLANNCDDALFRELGQWTTSELATTMNNFALAGASTPNVGIAAVQSKGYLTDASDPDTDTRTKAVVVMSDNSGNSCDTFAAPAATTAAQLAADGVTVHVIGFNWIDPTAWLDGVAAAGGGQRHLADTPAELTAALNTIRDSMSGPCNIQVDMIDDPTKVWVTIDGTAVVPDPVNGFSAAGDTVTLSGASCTLAQNGQIDIVFGCRVPCDPTPEVCNYMDDDCNGVADEGCSTCAPEICNGGDDDCDGQVDEGC